MEAKSMTDAMLVGAVASLPFRLCEDGLQAEICSVP